MLFLNYVVYGVVLSQQTKQNKTKLLKPNEKTNHTNILLIKRKCIFNFFFFLAEFSKGFDPGPVNKVKRYTMMLCLICVLLLIKLSWNIIEQYHCMIIYLLLTKIMPKMPNSKNIDQTVMQPTISYWTHWRESSLFFFWLQTCSLFFLDNICYNSL